MTLLSTLKIHQIVACSKSSLSDIIIIVIANTDGKKNALFSAPKQPWMTRAVLNDREEGNAIIPTQRSQPVLLPWTPCHRWLWYH